MFASPKRRKSVWRTRWLKQKLLLALSNPCYLLFKWRWGKEVEISEDILIPISFPLQDKHEKIPIIVMLICSQLDPKPTQVNESSYSFLFSITLHKASRTVFPNTERRRSSPRGKDVFSHYAVTCFCWKESKVPLRLGKRLAKAV